MCFLREPFRIQQAAYRLLDQSMERPVVFSVQIKIVVSPQLRYKHKRCNSEKMVMQRHCSPVQLQWKSAIGGDFYQRCAVFSDAPIEQILTICGDARSGNCKCTPVCEIVVTISCILPRHVVKKCSCRFCELEQPGLDLDLVAGPNPPKIGRASCRERV